MVEGSSVKRNFIVNFVRIFLSMIFPLITLPYACRIIHAEGIGRVSFVQGLTNYFVLLSSLGIPLYGIRAVAKVRDDKDKLSKLVKELLFILCISSFIIFILFLLFINIGKGKIDGNRRLLLLFSFSIILTNIGADWFYQGIEKYDYIAKVNIAFKLLSLILLFIIVNDEKDVLQYGFIVMFAILGSNLLNFINLRKYINWKKKYKLDIKKHMKPVIIIFGFNLAQSIYTSLDTVMLGFLATEEAVGIYSLAIKITKVVVTLVTSLSGVLIPRISYYIEKKEMLKFRKLVSISFNYVLFLALPCVVGLFILAPGVLKLVGGEEFIEGATAMRIILPIIVLIGFSDFLGVQILYPHGKDKKFLLSVIVGAISNFSLNLLLIPRYSYIGASIATLIAEVLVFIVLIIEVKEILNFRIVNKDSFRYIFATIIMGGILSIIARYGMFSSALLVLYIFLGAFVYFGSLVLMKERCIMGKILKRW
ncbi:flippase [Clostridium sp. DL1XJH146]